MPSKLPAYATEIPRPERFVGKPRRKRDKRHSSISWGCTYAIDGATDVHETWMAMSDGPPMHWLRVSAPGGSVSFNNPDDPVALAKSAIAFLASRSEGVNLENRVESSTR